jgi:repressor LexA
MALSERQQKILEFIRRFTLENEYPPTIREIGAAVGISSTSVVNYNLNILQREGHILRSKEVSRGIRLREGLKELASGHIVKVPLLGRIAAGLPIPVPDSDFSPLAGESVELTRDIVKEEEGVYALEVRGDSMIDALINDGDIVVMKHQQEANNGDLVAVWLKDEKETTLKRFYHEGSRVRLQPANPTMEPIYVDASNVEVQGKVIVVIRQIN